MPIYLNVPLTITNAVVNALNVCVQNGTHLYQASAHQATVTKQWIGQNVGPLAMRTAEIAGPYVTRGVEIAAPICHASAEATRAASEWAREEVFGPIYQAGAEATAPPIAWVKQTAEDAVYKGIVITHAVVLKSVIFVDKAREKAVQVKNQINDRMTAGLRQRLEIARQNNLQLAQQHQQALQQLAQAQADQQQVAARIQGLNAGQINEAAEGQEPADQEFYPIGELLEQAEQELGVAREVLEQVLAPVLEAEAEAAALEEQANQAEAQAEQDLAAAQAEREAAENLLHQRQQDAEEAQALVQEAHNQEAADVQAELAVFEQRVQQLREKSAEILAKLTRQNNLLVSLHGDASRQNPLLAEFKNLCSEIQAKLNELGSGYNDYVPDQNPKLDGFIAALERNIGPLHDQQAQLQAIKTQIENQITNDLANITTIQTANALAGRLFGALHKLDEALALTQSESNRLDAMIEYCTDLKVILNECDRDMGCPYFWANFWNWGTNFVLPGIAYALGSANKVQRIEYVTDRNKILYAQMTSLVNGISNLSTASGLSAFIQETLAQLSEEIDE